MTITQTNSSASADLLALLQGAQSSATASTSSSTQTSSTSSTDSTGDSTSVSGPGKLFSELEQLSKSDPTEFKQITASISQQLSAAAGSATNSGQASFLSQMATNFENASQSGNFSDLLPQNGSPPPSGAPGPQSTASTAYSSNSSNPVESIFSQALQQIQSYLGSSSTTTSSS
jgi:trimeric autotransporter adhesin